MKFKVGDFVVHKSEFSGKRQHSKNVYSVDLLFSGRHNGWTNPAAIRNIILDPEIVSSRLANPNNLRLATNGEIIEALSQSIKIQILENIGETI